MMEMREIANMVIDQVERFSGLQGRQAYKLKLEVGQHARRRIGWTIALLHKNRVRHRIGSF